jgi:UDP-glucose 4-epimerase
MNGQPIRAIVTGGAGFIGGHLVERLLADGREVVVIDDFSGGSEENLKAVREHPGLAVHRADIAEGETIRPLLEGADWVFHLAGRSDIVPSIQHPLRYHRSNVDGTIAVLEAARAAGVARFVYSASSSCYGIPDVYPTPETAPIRPLYPYALTKYVAEEYVLHWQRLYDLPAVSLRIFNAYGPRVRTTNAYGAVFGVFLAQKLAGKPFTVVGDGAQTRDFVFVTDVVDAFVRAAESDVVGEAMNIGAGGTVSVNRLVELLGGEVIHIPKRPGEPDCTFADTAKINRLLGWRPQVSFEEGVRRMLDNIDYWRRAPVWTPDTIAEATADWFRHLGGAAP